MRIGFVSPYLDSLGGGERYTLTLAVHWARHHDVTVFWDDPRIIKEADRRLSVDLSRIKIVPNIFRGKNLLKKLFFTRQYDLLFFLSDGSVPSSLARYNLLHFQVPFAQVAVSALKLSRYQAVICNSQFTLKYLEPRLLPKAVVIYPPVAAVGRSGVKKEKIILSVGRFSSHFQAKKQEVLIEAMRELVRTKLFRDWKLVLIGGLLRSDQAYFDKLNERAKGLPIELIPNILFSELISWYNRASLYWHAAGFGETDPVRMEHFGISTVEAMSAGGVPLVYQGGGQPEIIEDGKHGYFWQSQVELVEKTVEIIQDQKLQSQLSVTAQKRAADFRPERFYAGFDDLLARIIT